MILYITCSKLHCVDSLSGEAVNASAGLGFNGYDDLGRSKWDLIDNADIYRVEVN